MNPFTERYRDYSLGQLLEVLEKRAGYRPEAVQAAEEELQRRNVSEEELAQARERLAAQLESERAKKEKLEAVYSKVSSRTSTVWSHLTGPDSRKDPALTVRVFAAAWALYTLYDAFFTPRLQLALYSYDYRPGAIVLMTMVPLFALTACVFLWLRSVVGWTMAVIHFTINLVFGLLYFVDTAQEILFPEPVANQYEQIEELFKPQLDPVVLTYLFVYGAVLYYLNTPRVRFLFKARRARRFVTVISGLVIAVLLFLAVN